MKPRRPSRADRGSVATGGRTFDAFAVGDHASFEHRFTAADFKTFSALSGDANPLHADAGYAATSSFGKPIVPLHLVLSPLSMIAGMIFPGEPALYLGHDVRALKPVFYDEPIVYSARIVGLERTLRVLRLRVIGFCGTEVKLDATMQVQAREATWTTPPALPIMPGSDRGTALVTGASGAIGAAASLALARAGWRLLLQHRGGAKAAAALAARLAARDVEARFVEADLNRADGIARLVKAIAAEPQLSAIVHAASPPLTAPIDDLVRVNFTALRTMAEAALPGLLRRQDGRILLVGSRATHYRLPGWEDYSAAKAMAANYLTGLDQAYGGFGVRCLTLAPGLVDTRFSAAHRISGDTPLMSEEVAEHLAAFLAAPGADENYRIVQPGGDVAGRFGFQRSSPQNAWRGGDQWAPEAATRAAPRSGGNGQDGAARSAPADALPIAAVVRRQLGLSDGVDLSSGGLGLTPGWDSLKHIEIILALEEAFGIQLQSSEIERTTLFAELEATCRRKLATPGHRGGPRQTEREI